MNLLSKSLTNLFKSFIKKIKLILDRVSSYFLKPHFHFNRAQFDLIVIFLISVGIFFSFFVAASDILPKIFAATSWTQTDWSGGVGSSTTNQYSAGSNIDAITTAGQATLTNIEKLSNTGFETDLTSWATGEQPDTIANLKMWLKADSLTANDGDAVPTWTDSGSSGNSPTQATTSKQATYKTNIINGKPVLRFNGTSNQYGITLNSGIALNNYSLFVVHRPTSATQYGIMIGANTGNSDAELLDISYPAAGKIGTYHAGPGNVGGSYNFTTGTALLSSFVASSGTGIPYFNGTAETSGSTATETVSTWALGNWTSGSYYYTGDIAEVILYSAGLSAANRTAVENYLATKYGITVTSGITQTRDTTVHHSGAASAKLVATGIGEFTQTINVGNTNKYNLVAYAYIDGSTAVDNTYVQLYYNGSALTTTDTSVGGGWYKLSAVVDGANTNRQYGVQVKANKTVYLDDFSLNNYSTPAVLTSNIYDTGVGEAWGTLTYTTTTPTNTSVTVKVRAGNVADLSDATAFASCSAVASGVDLTGGCIPDNKRYVQYQITLSTTDTTVTPTVSDITINYSPYDTVPPTTNASSILMYTSNGGRSIASNGWNNATSPYFSWTAGADNGGGSGLLGYCLYLGTDSAGAPATSKGVLGTTPVSIPSNSTCQFIISSTSIDLLTSGYLGSALASGSTYYLNIDAIDNGGNVYTGTAATFHFRHDSTSPTNLAYLTMPSQNYSNVADMNFSWPTSGGSASSDSDAGVLGWQYQINSSSGTWQGTTHDSTLNLDYIPATASAYTLVSGRDSSAVVSGNNVVYFRTVDSAGNTSSSSTYRTGNLTYGGAAPSFPGDGSVTVTPSTATTNSFALSWSTATAPGSYAVAKYYYMVNTSPPLTLATLQGNSSVYVDNGTSITVSAKALANVNKGTNTVYVVAIDNASTPNYSPSNDITGTFTLNSTDPDPVQNLVASDSSIKSQSQWNVTLTWTAGDYQGAGNLTYLVDRSTDNATFTQVGTTTGLSYVDNTPSSTKYYYKIITKDGASATSSDSTTVSITPTGKYTTAPSLESGPTASSVTTKRATVTWSTSRTADSKVSYGTSSGSYGSVDASNTDQVTSHSIKLTNLSAGTTYYYVVKWTDGDGNTGTSDEKTFSTDTAPTVTDPKAVSIGLDTVDLQYTVKGASSVNIYYGTSTAFGGLKTIDTSTNETTYDTQLTGLLDGTKYYYKINTVDSEDTEYEGNILSFDTLPRPKISTVRIQEVTGTAQPTVLISWTTNTQVSSIVTYYPKGQTNQSHDQVNVALVTGEHKMLISSLFAQTSYNLVVKGVDKAGNEAISDTQTFITSTDTRPPAFANLNVQGGSVQPASSNQQPTAQLIVSWDTDEPGTSQVEFGEGTGTTYSSQTQEDQSLTSNHVVIISGLTPSKVYHLRALSKDKAGNQGKSIDTVTITPKATDNALNLVISNLQSVFGFLGGGK